MQRYGVKLGTWSPNSFDTHRMSWAAVAWEDAESYMATIQLERTGAIEPGQTTRISDRLLADSSPEGVTCVTIG